MAFMQINANSVLERMYNYRSRQIYRFNDLDQELVKVLDRLVERNQVIESLLRKLDIIEIF